jgi:hypothetical protein
MQPLKKRPGSGSEPVIQIRGSGTVTLVFPHNILKSGVKNVINTMEKKKVKKKLISCERDLRRRGLFCEVLCSAWPL